MKKNSTLVFTWIFCILSIHSLFAQEQKPILDVAYQHVAQMANEWGLQTTDYADMIVSDQYVAKHIGVTHIYFVQRYKSIPVFGAINGIHIDSDGKVAFATNTFEPNLAERTNASSPTISAQQAVAFALSSLDITATRPLELLSQAGQHFTFSGGNVAHNDIKVMLRYMPMRKTGTIRLAWDMAIDVVGSADYWSLRIDAITGELLHKNNWTLYCSFGEGGHFLEHADHCAHQEAKGTANFYTLEKNNEELVDADTMATYRVFPIPVESPIHGERELVINPHDPTASPFGWHDTNGEVGADYTITRGNNVHAYLDEGSINSSVGDEPEGGPNLLFDFYFDINEEPDTLKEAAVTQLFYMVNMIHDITYAYGFNEEAGNFQRNNYGAGGEGFDHVLAEAQDGSGTNNANFSTPADGQNGRMQMFLWEGVGGRLLNVESPTILVGDYETGTASFGPPVSSVPITAEIVRAYDDTGSPFIVCEEVANASEINGKIALIDRGFCFFEEKTLNAQAAGAVAVIICNFEEVPPGMAGGVDGVDPDIPTISLKASDCAQIKAQLELGNTVMATIVSPENNGPVSIDADFDNGIIAHEYGHGISNRLTGGPSASGCLNSAAQMGEGWSDFFTLLTSVRPGDTGATARGIGNYADRKEVDGRGIRRLPYSTDFSVNNQTYDDIIGVFGSPHNIGEVWVSTIWDLYWTLVDEYGYDEDLVNGTGGNNIAIQLVMDGMAFQSCNPGFIDGRDAIFTADFINYEGIHECLIWEVFARRGLGFSASQGDRFDAEDGIPDFNTIPLCVRELKINKSADKDLVLAGEQITFTLDVLNHKETAVTAVVVDDILPDGLSYVAGSAVGADVTDNGNSLTFTIGNMDAGEERVITYQVNTDPSYFSTSQYFDGMENGSGDENWEYGVESGSDIWEIVTNDPYAGERSWFIPNTQIDNDQRIEQLDPVMVSGDAPAVRFYHKYNTQPKLDGGLIEVSTDGGTVWERVDGKFLRNDYRGNLASRTLFAANVGSFWGNSNSYIDSYIDLSDYIGEMIQIRFRWASNDDGESPVFPVGWFVDNFEMMDLKAYEGEACVNSAEGDMNCAVMPDNGVIIDTDLMTSTVEPSRRPDILKVYPNPTQGVMNIGLNGVFQDNITVSLININGVLVREWPNQSSVGQYMPFDVAGLPVGFYVVKVTTENGAFTEKVAIH